MSYNAFELKSAFDQAGGSSDSQGRKAGFKQSVKGVFDTAYYGYDLNIPLDDASLTNVSTFTYSTGITQRRRTVEAFQTQKGVAATNFEPLLHSVEAFMAQDDTVPFLHAGNNTAINQNYLIEADMTAQVHQIQVLCAFILNMSAWTNGSANLDSITLTLQSYVDAGVPSEASSQIVISPATAFSALGAASTTQVLFVRAFWDVNTKLFSNTPATLNVTTNITSSGTNTWQVGILPRFSYITNNILKKWFVSQAIAHIHPVPDHANELIKSTKFDIEGVSPPFEY